VILFGDYTMNKFCIGILVACLLSPASQVRAVDDFKAVEIATGTFVLGSVIGAAVMAKIIYNRLNQDPFPCTKVSQKF
jgi:hypothetical protein